MPNTGLSEPLIEKDEAEAKQKRPTRNLVKILSILQFISICVLPVLYTLGYKHGSRQLPKVPTHAVSKDGFQLQLQHLDDAFEVKSLENMKFKGLPRPELNDAWNGLLEHMNIRVHPDEARQSSNFSSIQLNDGTGDFQGMPAVFHGLHCLKTIREYVFPEAYPDTWEQFKPPFPGGISRHMDHCIENLRQAIMCQGDLALYTYEWLPEQDEPNIIAGMQHVCVDFNKVMDWARKRSFSIYDGLLQNPYRDAPWDPHTLKHGH
ncbi:uncharacterized protein DNG_02302 [Cephalotrichum gorgonifer]|uniref:Tat pathway signal sequence n=1 Tax=Cephalotrichum gorgonifer TaxID=2041049 RepID=A0AAE8MT87_9PEZI|nr:uncharacterized protein DNG_02302 [Cephalotrichum gorgonifer]